ncbi:MAG: XRE family transcriptional regulator [Clostridium sp.]|nr:XRE family transcriptional regulator [Clostridium sp.]
MVESGGTADTRNIYLACRKQAAESNERLNSREIAADLLGISASTLAKHELGVTKCVPVDTVVMMADLYKAPELRNWYCKNECPIGEQRPMATRIGSIERITVKLLADMDGDRISRMKADLLDIARDGKVTPDEAGKMQKVMELLDELTETISELRMYAEKSRRSETDG